MIKVHARVEIRRPVDQVFSFLADVGNAPRWQRGVVSSKKLTEGPPRVGTRFTESMKVMGMAFEAMCEITVLDPPRNLTMVADGKLVHYQGGFSFRPVPDGTELALDGEVAFKGFWRLLTPLLAGEIRKETKAELDDIKSVLESAQQVAPA
jgi:uncharacterized membrane protein